MHTWWVVGLVACLCATAITGVDEEGRYFTAKRRKRTLLFILLPFVWVVGTMAAAIELMAWLTPSGTGAGAATLCLSGMALAFGGGFACAVRVPFWSMRSFRDGARRKIEAAYGADLSGHTYVGLSPGAETRLYENETSWDIGFLRVGPDLFTYYGDRTRFDLRSEEIVGASVITHDWVMGDRQRVVVTWQPPGGSEPEAFSLEMRDARSAAELLRLSREMAARIEQWRTVVPRRSDVAAAGVPPSRIPLGAPLPVMRQPNTGKAYAMAAGVCTSAMIAVEYAVLRLFGKDVLNSPVVHYGILAATGAGMNALAPALRNRMNRRTPQPDD